MVRLRYHISPLLQQLQCTRTLSSNRCRRITSQRYPDWYLLPLPYTLFAQDIDNDFTPFYNITWLLPIRRPRRSQILPHPSLTIALQFLCAPNPLARIEKIGAEVPGLNDRDANTERREFISQSFREARDSELSRAVKRIPSSTIPAPYATEICNSSMVRCGSSAHMWQEGFAHVQRTQHVRAEDGEIFGW